ncbi:MAG TPA: metallophosphoesterase family protein [Syntrophobacteraceae bacterium]|nr:metallophosphoesterase family protein [Syntrophobacteraceae bacterium]
MSGEMKIVVMSDTHLGKVTDEFKTLCSKFCDGADMVIHLGDWVSDEVLNYMGRYPLEAVSGNMDDYSILKRLPPRKVVKTGPFHLGIIHGWGSPFGIRQRLSKEFTGVDAILFGHTHQPLIIRENGVLWFNPGSLLRGREPHLKTIGVLTIQDEIKADVLEIHGI